MYYMFLNGNNVFVQSDEFLLLRYDNKIKIKTQYFEMRYFYQQFMSYLCVHNQHIRHFPQSLAAQELFFGCAPWLAVI